MFKIFSNQTLASNLPIRICILKAEMVHTVRVTNTSFVKRWCRRVVFSMENASWRASYFLRSHLRIVRRSHHALLSLWWFKLQVNPFSTHLLPPSLDQHLCGWPRRSQWFPLLFYTWPVPPGSYTASPCSYFPSSPLLPSSVMTYHSLGVSDAIKS